MILAWENLRSFAVQSIDSALKSFPEKSHHDGEQFLGELLRLMGFSYKEISFVVGDSSIPSTAEVVFDEPTLRLAFINFRDQRPMRSVAFELEVLCDFLRAAGMTFIDLLRLLHDQPPTNVAEVVAASTEPE